MTLNGCHSQPTCLLICRPSVSLHRPELRRRPPGSSRAPVLSLVSFPRSNLCPAPDVRPCRRSRPDQPRGRCACSGEAGCGSVMVTGQRFRRLLVPQAPRWEAADGVRRQDDERRAIPRRPIATVAPGRQPAGAGPPLRSGPTGDCRGRPCRKALAGQPEGWPAFRTNKRSAPLSRRAGTETTSSTAGPTPGKPPSSSAGGHSGRDTAAEARSRITNRTSRTTATRPATWRRSRDTGED